MHKNAGKLLIRLADICSRLRAENGCLWDREQTHKSLIKCLREESEEVVQAIKNKDPENLREELGDLLYQVIFHSQIASENKQFTLEDVISDIMEKIIRRHPHIFAGTKVSSVKDILDNWEIIKKQEKKIKKPGKKR